MTEEKHSLKHVQELNTIGNQLIREISHLFKQVDAYNDHYYVQNFYPQILINDKDGIKTRKEIKKGETIFDRIYESTSRNDFVLKSIENVKEIIKEIENILETIQKEFINENNVLTKIIKCV